jgi:uncharacterized protein
LLVLLGVGCGIVALAIWLWSPDRSALTATAPPRPSAPPVRPAAPPATAAPTREPRVAAATAAPSPAATAAATATAAAAAPVTAEPGRRPRLAIIIDDCGQWPVTERAFVALPFPLTLSVLPHVRFASAIARDASAAGKGVMLHLPM